MSPFQISDGPKVVWLQKVDPLPNKQVHHYAIREKKSKTIQTRKAKHDILKTSLTFKCLIEHLLADFYYSRPLDTYL